VGPDIIVPVATVFCIAGAVILRGPLGRALADRIARRAPAPDGHTVEVASQTTLEIEDVRQRLAELEERQDFTERMLTRARESGDLGPGRSTRAP
jgi:hypothetical protein